MSFETHCCPTDIKVGDHLWWARWERQAQHSRPCPVCYGKREVTLILGNGDTVTTPCDYCGKGFEGPRGVVKEYGPLAAAEPVTISSVTATETADGTEYEYRARSSECSSWVPVAADLFRTEAEALVRAEEKAEAERVRMEQSTAYLKHEAHKSISWHVGYHLREAKRHRREAEYHENMAKLCKAKAEDGEE